MLQCFFCANPADRVAYYSKSYFDFVMSWRITIENPTIVCKTCFESSRIMNQINPLRGGNEGIYCYLFSTIGKWNPKEIGYFLSKKRFEINHLATLPWRKLMWRIRFANQPKKGKDGERIESSSPGI